MTAAAQQGGVRAGPCIDGYYLPETPDAIFAAGKQNDVSVLTSSTANDIGNTPAILVRTTVPSLPTVSGYEIYEINALWESV